MNEATAREQRIQADAGAVVFAALDGDLHVHGPTPPYRIEPVPPRADRPPGGEADGTAWLGSGQPGLWVTLVDAVDEDRHDTAARWLAHSTRPTDCAVVRAVPGAPDDVPGWPRDPRPNLCLIVEHADRWSLDCLLLLIRDCQLLPRRVTRVFLVTHRNGPWWPALRHRLDKAGVRAERSHPWPG